MSDINVLVVFYSRYGNAERIALAAGVGAIQARANIRLRRVADHADAKTIDATPAWRQNLDRMNRDYVAPSGGSAVGGCRRADDAARVLRGDRIVLRLASVDRFDARQDRRTARGA